MSRISLIFLAIFTNQAFTQDAALIRSNVLEGRIDEELIDAESINIDDDLTLFDNSPLNINKASFEELVGLGIFTNLQVLEILQHIIDFGPLLCIEELQSIQCLSLDDIQNCRHFVYVNMSEYNPISLDELLPGLNSEVILKWNRTLEKQAGYFNSNGDAPFLGDANKLLFRFKSAYQNRVRFGITLEKDAGERFGRNSKSLGFDFMSSHIHLKNYSKNVQDLIIGDFSISAGQGLIYHSDFSAGKSSHLKNLIKGGRYVKAYGSINENSYYRGLATSLRFGEFIEFSCFVSRSKRDGNVVLDSSIVNQVKTLASSFQNTGYHRTENELEDKNAISLLAYGSRIKFIGTNSYVALNLAHHSFSPGFVTSDAIAKLYNSLEHRLDNTSIEYNYRLNNISLFGEMAYALNHGIANLTGLLISIDKDISLGLVYRAYAKDYISLMSNAIGETTGVNNENGVYFGVTYKIGRFWSINLYADFWEHPWVRSTINHLGSGREYFFKLEYKVKHKVNFYIQYMNENKLMNMSSSESQIIATQSQKRQKLRFNVVHYPVKSLTFRTRLEFISYSNLVKASSGVLLFQDFIFKNIESPFSFTSRIALFDTDDYDSRIYAYENSLLNDFSIPAYSGQGFRYYFNLRYKINLSNMLEFRIARTHLIDRDFIGSSYSSINEDTKTDFAVQYRCKF